MLTRATTTTISYRAAAIRRLRRRAASAGRLYCSTNGCTSFLEIDTENRVATCQVCGYQRRLS